MSNLFAKDALVVPFEQLRMADVESVGGKNASLGEMISQLPNGVRVPTGFATTAFAFRAFLKHDGLVDRINQKLDALDVEDVRTLATVGAEIRAMVEAQPFLPILRNPFAINSPFSVRAIHKLHLPFVLLQQQKICPMLLLQASKRRS